MRAPAVQVLAFYQKLMEQTGLTILPDPRPDRMCPGFRARSAEFGFRISVYERRGLSIWNIALSTESYKKRKWLPLRLVLLDKNDERVRMQTESHRPTECWAPVAALCDTLPPKESPPKGIQSFKTTPILWSSLPKWVQFNIQEEKRGEVRLFNEENGVKEWNAEVSVRIDGNPRSIFESCLDSLEAEGFAEGGAPEPEQGYYISLLGDWPSVDFQSRTGDGGGVRVWNPQRHWDLEVWYTPAPGVPPPVFVE